VQLDSTGELETPSASAIQAPDIEIDDGKISIINIIAIMLRFALRTETFGTVSWLQCYSTRLNFNYS